MMKIKERLKSWIKNWLSWKKSWALKVIKRKKLKSCNNQKWKEWVKDSWIF